MHILEEKIRAARADGRHALIPFVTFGFPDEKRFWPALVELDESGADIIEIGVPFPTLWPTGLWWRKPRAGS